MSKPIPSAPKPATRPAGTAADMVIVTNDGPAARQVPRGSTATREPAAAAAAAALRQANRVEASPTVEPPPPPPPSPMSSATGSLADWVGHRCAPVPVLTLVASRWAWLLGAALAGAALGLTMTWGPSTYTASATLRLADTGRDSLRTKQLGQTVEHAVHSDRVLARTARTRGVAPDDLDRRVEAAWLLDTDLVRVTVRNPDPRAAVGEANALAEAVVAVSTEEAAERITRIRAEAERQLREGTLEAPAAEQARKAQLGGALAVHQDAAASNTAQVSIGDLADRAAAQGLSPLLGLALGATAGLGIAAAAAALSGVGLRRPARASEVAWAAPGAIVRGTAQAGEVAGRFMTTNLTTLVVLALPESALGASRFADAVAAHLEEHGLSVAIVDATSASAVSASGRLRALRRDVRRDVRTHLDADLAVVVANANPASIGLVAGQDDVMTVIVARLRRTRLRDVSRLLAAVAPSDPVVVVTHQ